MSNKTFFGFKEVDINEKASMVQSVFSSVASKYDIMNDVMSFGIHRIWKDQFIKTLSPKDNTKLLDVAGGTGDIAFRYLKNTNNCHATICDINSAMLEEGRCNAINQNILNGLDWLCGNAEELPIPDATYDYYTIAFGIRNVTDIPKALGEAYRILKPGGRFLCLEFSKVNNPLLSSAYDFYSFNVIPKMGECIAGDKDSYQYLVESIRKFPPQEKFLRMIKNAGFERCSYNNMTAGTVAIHSGYKG